MYQCPHCGCWNADAGSAAHIVRACACSLSEIRPALGWQGDLALLAREGSRGIPVGHIVAHNAHHGLHLKFLRALHAAATDDDYIGVEAPGEGVAAAASPADDDSNGAVQE